MKNYTRRKFVKSLGVTAFGAFAFPKLLFGLTNNWLANSRLKPIEGSWFEFQHHSVIEGTYWNHALVEFTKRQWDYKIKEIALSGIRYLVLLNTAIGEKSFYPSNILSKHDFSCHDPLEVVLSAADKYGVKFFISNGFYGEWTNPYFLMQDKNIQKIRLKAMNEIAQKYAHHESFYGWYYPNEIEIKGHFDNIFINYVNACSEEAKRITPQAKVLIAPYGTRNVAHDELYMKQLEQLEVDFIAYQDEVGVQKTNVEELEPIFEKLYSMHSKIAKSQLWADIEIFDFEGEVYKSPLIPAQAERIEQQIKAVKNYVEKIFIYQYIGLLNRNGTYSFAGQPNSSKLHQELKRKQLLS